MSPYEMIQQEFPYTAVKVIHGEFLRRQRVVTTTWAASFRFFHVFLWLALRNCQLQYWAGRAGFLKGQLRRSSVLLTHCVLMAARGVSGSLAYAIGGQRIANVGITLQLARRCSALSRGYYRKC